MTSFLKEIENQKLRITFRGFTLTENQSSNYVRMYQIFLHKFFSQLRLTKVVVELCNFNPKFTGPYLLKNRDNCGSTLSIYNLDNFTTYRINLMFPAVFPNRGRSSDGRALAQHARGTGIDTRRLHNHLFSQLLESLYQNQLDMN